ncbi:DJ-1/PfpI family protein [Alkaliphilus hydrothermalis]|uniref:Intracellular protease/amidase n=1 Tax=Alkaliphilus hydrothermalis TaxID=1482730 RepID=A0ABS2NLA1_9FIRM|nr:DJ-1/PfpI family protein [Alkaliphilus hydrothermalis]MBM7613718.1 putative intracellular protease/amidase [Alkaliphilus hydrothermalis]
MGKILVFIYDDMADFEITLATHLLGINGGKKIMTIAYEKKLIKSRAGMTYLPDIMVKDVVIDEETEGILITGGWNGEIREELMELIRNLNQENKLLAAVCAGPRFLAKAGVLNDRNYTTSIIEWTEQHREQFKDEIDPFPRENFENKRVMRDQNIITAQGVAFIDFAIEICDYFFMFEDAEDRANFRKYFTEC